MKSDRTYYNGSTARMDHMLKKYKKTWQYKPTDEIEKEVDERCRGLQSWHSDEKVALCSAISDILQKIRIDKADSYYRSRDCEYLLNTRAIACQADDLGYTEDEFTCELTTKIANEMGCKR